MSGIFPQFPEDAVVGVRDTAKLSSSIYFMIKRNCPLKALKIEYTEQNTEAISFQHR